MNFRVLVIFSDSQVALVVKNPPAMQEIPETQIWSLGPEDLEEEMATHSSILAWRIPWTEEPGGLQSMGSHRVGHDWSDWANHTWIYEVRVSVLEELWVFILNHVKSMVNKTFQWFEVFHIKVHLNQTWACICYWCACFLACSLPKEKMQCSYALLSGVRMGIFRKFEASASIKFYMLFLSSNFSTGAFHNFSK